MALASRAGTTLLPEIAAGEWTPYGDNTFVTEAGEGGPVWKLSATNPGRQTGARIGMALPAGTEVIRVALAYKATGLVRGEKAWHNARVRIDFLDDAGARIGESHAIDRIEGTHPEWQAVERRFSAPAGARRVSLALEIFLARAGAIEFRDLTVAALDREAAEAWRVEADTRIARHRQAELNVDVVDEDGRPLENAQVRVRMKRHAYPFGSAVTATGLLKEPTTTGERNYRETALAFFNYVTLENDLKQKLIERKGSGPAVAALEMLRAHGIQTRGHVLVWPSWDQSAPALRALKDKPEEARQWVRDHIRSLMSATSGLTRDWDVMNEPVVHNDLINLLGRDEVAEWFRMARAGDPRTAVYLNENNVEFNGSNQAALEGWIDFLRAKGAPLDGVGWQGHMWHRTLPYGPGILDDLARFEKYGLKIQVTEYDCNDRFGDEEEARFLKDFLHAWFSHPLTDGFIMWGFYDGASWTDNAPLFNRDWSLKPAGKVWMDQVFGAWWSDADLKTDATGDCATRAFLGVYAVQVVHGGKVETVETSLPQEGRKLRVTVGKQSAVWEEARRLPDYNPYRAGRLPVVVEASPSLAAKSAAELVVSTGDGAGADASTGTGAPLGDQAELVVAGAAEMKARRDLYLRFDLSKQDNAAPGEVGLVLKPAGESEGEFRAKVYALSPRFVPAEGELGADWAESLLVAGNAPGRVSDDGDYRLGDASLSYLGEWRGATTDGELRWSSDALTAAAAKAGGKMLTLLIVPEEGITAAFRSKEYASSEAPRLVLRY